ncbi:Uma2 family endonuclease [Planktothrix sp. FACHB-1365]|uniref:Uma2 family endonuclease n=1 Tax=Planktothrix sp. FACHB-1365 TaxID=2692855 RepID=UPI00168A1981|nr:Uma2 family endonuclease [Planktothrix sp. FACHB-1365]MBD2482973.1 Uma2 family endonuclease [Planktothrix sp. FACHB-1365]
MSSQLQTRYYTPEEYLEWEEQADYKHEYRDGEIVPMTGGTTNHNKIALNVAAYLKFALRGQNYDVYIGDVRLWIPRYRQYTYPDIMVIQRPPVYSGTGTTTVMNPMLITEVLSKSTQNYDQGDKFTYYRSIPELQEYILIAQQDYKVMQYVKNDKSQWILTEYEGETSQFKLASFDIHFNFNELYEGVDFNQQEFSNNQNLSE